MERKTIPDLLASIKDGRYEEQSHRLIYSSGFQNHNIIYIIEGSLSNIQLSDKKMVFSCITSLNYYKGFSVFRTNTVKETAELIYYMSEKINRNMKKGIQPFSQEKNMDNEQNEQIGQNEPKIDSYSNFVKKVKRDNITKDNIGEIMLCQIPGISSKTANVILQKFGSIYNLMKEIETNSATCFENLYIENDGKTRKISKACIANIITFLSIR